MVFSSYVFIFAFLPAVLLGFYALRFLGQNTLAKVFLLLGSLFFYAFWEVKYLAILLFSIIVNYGIATYMLKQYARNFGGGGGNPA